MPKKHNMTELQALLQNKIESSFRHPGQKCGEISEIKELPSMEVETPLQLSRITDMKDVNQDS